MKISERKTIIPKMKKIITEVQIGEKITIETIIEKIGITVRDFIINIKIVEVEVKTDMMIVLKIDTKMIEMIEIRLLHLSLLLHLSRWKRWCI